MADVEVPDWLKIISVDDINYTKKDPVKVENHNNHLTFDSGVLHADTANLQADSINNRITDEKNLVLQRNLTSNLETKPAKDNVVIAGESDKLNPVKIETFDHKNEAPDLEKVSLKHSNPELKSMGADHLLNLVPYPIPVARVDPVKVSKDAGEVIVRDKCDEFSCLNQGKCVDDGTVYRNKLRCDCVLGSTGKKCEKGEYTDFVHSILLKQIHQQPLYYRGCW